MSSSFFSKKVKFFITDETVDLMIREIADQDPWVCMMMFDALTSHLLKTSNFIGLLHFATLVLWAEVPLLPLFGRITFKLSRSVVGSSLTARYRK